MDNTNKTVTLTEFLYGLKNDDEYDYHITVKENGFQRCEGTVRQLLDSTDEKYMSVKDKIMHSIEHYDGKSYVLNVE